MKEREELEKEVEMDVKDEKEQVSNQAKPNALALIPFIVFVAVYLGSGIILDMSGMEMAFYQFPAPLAAAIGAITAFLSLKVILKKNLKRLLQAVVIPTSSLCVSSTCWLVALPLPVKPWVVSIRRLTWA